MKADNPNLPRLTDGTLSRYTSMGCYPLVYFANGSAYAETEEW